MAGLKLTWTGRPVIARLHWLIVMLWPFASKIATYLTAPLSAVGYLLKDSPPPELLAAVRAAAEGQAPTAPRPRCGDEENLPE